VLRLHGEAGAGVGGSVVTSDGSDKKWALRRLVIGSTCEVEISDEVAQRAIESMKFLHTFASFEAKFEMLLENFIDLEKELYSISLEWQLKRFIDYQKFGDIRQRVDRRLTNFLSVARQYIEHSKRHLDRFYSQPNGGLDALFSERYDQSFAYRLMEALRNYVQHKDLGVGGISIGGHWVDEGDERLHEYYTRILLDIKKIENDGEFKSSVLKEMDENEFEVDILQCARLYVSDISKIHAKIRCDLEERFNLSKNCIDWCYDSFEKEESNFGIYVCRYNASNNWQGVCELFSGPADIIDGYMVKNQCPMNVGPSYVSTKIKPKKKQRKTSI
jgi:hypothetical protein